MTLPPRGSRDRRLRLALVAAGADLAAAGLILPVEGNLSARLDADRALITPAGRDKARLRACDCLEVSLDPQVPHPAGASSETDLHRCIYRLRPDVQAVVHAHPPRVLAELAAGRAPDWHLLEECELLLGPVTRTESLPAGSLALAQRVADNLRVAQATVMDRHGAVTVGANLAEGVLRMQLLERLARIAGAAT